MTKWCIISAGGIADRRFIPALNDDKENLVVAIMERVRERALELEEKWGVKCYTDEEEMLRSTDADAVYIGSPVACHKRQIELAFKYGKHIFVEKPLALCGDDAEELLALAKAKKLQLTVGYMMKYHNLHVLARDIIADGGIGEVNTVRASLSCWYPEIEGAWRQDPTLSGGGAVMDLAVHCIELLEYLLDEEICEVKSFISTRTFSYEVEDGAVIIFRTNGGVLGHIDVSFNVPDAATRSKLELYGSEGSLVAYGTLGQTEDGTLSYVHSPGGNYNASREATYVDCETFLAEGKDIYLRQVRDFNRILKLGIPEYGWTERAVQVQRVVDMIYRDAR